MMRCRLNEGEAREKRENLFVAKNEALKFNSENIDGGLSSRQVIILVPLLKKKMRNGKEKKKKERKG